MLEPVEDKIKEFEQQQKDEFYKRKNDDLVSWGLSGKKEAPLIVTDDEYEALITASSGISSVSRNKVARMMSISSVAIITVGIIIGAAAFALGSDLRLIYCSVSIVVSTLIALIFRGLGEAIRLLQQLLDIKQGEKFAQNKKKYGNTFPDQPSSEKPFSNAPEVHHVYPFGADNKKDGDKK